MSNNLHSAYRVNLNYDSKCKIQHKNISKTVDKICVNDLSNTILVTKVKVELLYKMVEKSYSKTVIDFNFGRHKDLSSLKISPRPCGLGEYHFFV